MHAENNYGKFHVHLQLYTSTRAVAREKLKDSYVKRITLLVRPYFDDPDKVAEGLYEMIARYK